ncbi:winged helix-turn-helix transcriptional regulator [Paracidovorax cattleyae]|uniref:DNA-binding transcriptional regulator, HxlR family n=1 Tax=Paracidovorax cattleyae TaxID=80868 RepID=A0A1H0WAB4_9BURK|nr:helix-turn-helix domain-containing protein [Paracidovorax cattleyae]SDP87719.1 DNA-binding transcriptional regulator, HxlR family [Paracidovorax cattleyae]
MPARKKPAVPADRPYDVYEERCPTRQVLERLADKWVLLILDRLESGPARFNGLKRDIRSVTQKVLTQSLRRLERDGLIVRTVYATTPVTVEYALTTLGGTLTQTVSAFAHWAEHNMDAVLAAQAAYDTAAAQPAAQPAHVRSVRGGKVVAA